MVAAGEESSAHGGAAVRPRLRPGMSGGGGGGTPRLETTVVGDETMALGDEGSRRRAARDRLGLGIDLDRGGRQLLS